MVKVLTMVKLFWYFGLNNCMIYHGEIHFYHAMRDRYALNVDLNMEKLRFLPWWNSSSIQGLPQRSYTRAAEWEVLRENGPLKYQDGWN
jgi:hypothetical protein